MHCRSRKGLLLAVMALAYLGFGTVLAADAVTAVEVEGNRTVGADFDPQSPAAGQWRHRHARPRSIRR